MSILIFSNYTRILCLVLPILVSVGLYIIYKLSFYFEHQEDHHSFPSSFTGNETSSKVFSLSPGTSSFATAAANCPTPSSLARIDTDEDIELVQELLSKESASSAWFDLEKASRFVTCPYRTPKENWFPKLEWTVGSPNVTSWYWPSSDLRHCWYHCFIALLRPPTTSHVYDYPCTHNIRSLCEKSKLTLAYHLQ